MKKYILALGILSLSLAASADLKVQNIIGQTADVVDITMPSYGEPNDIVLTLKNSNIIGVNTWDHSDRQKCSKITLIGPQSFDKYVTAKMLEATLFADKFSSKTTFINGNVGGSGADVCTLDFMSPGAPNGILYGK